VKQLKLMLRILIVAVVMIQVIRVVIDLHGVLPPQLRIVHMEVNSLIAYGFAAKMFWR
jgi:hypothetical protein